LFDQAHWVTAAEAFHATRQLHRQTALFCGGTSGAAWMVAAHIAREHPRAKVVCLFPDDGFRYADTVYNDQYLRAHGLCLDVLPSAPHEVEHPLAAEASWSWIRWNRRSYEDVVGTARVETASIGH
jgi:cysteine synthase A